MGFLDGLRVLGPEAEPRDDVAVDAEALLLDVAGHGEGRAHHIEEDQEEEILKFSMWPNWIWSPKFN